MKILEIVMLSMLTGCASIKDENGQVVGECFGASCLLRAAVGANTVDPTTGVMKGQIPLLTLGGTSAVPKTSTSN